MRAPFIGSRAAGVGAIFLLSSNFVYSASAPVEVACERKSQIADGVALFVPQGYKPQKTPSLAFARPPKELGELPAAWKLAPHFYQVNGQAGASFPVPADASLYGTGEVNGPLLRNSQSIELWNTDAYGYGDLKGSRLYQSHPWVLGVRKDGTAFGVLFDSTWRATLRTERDKIVFESEGAPFRVAVIDRDSPQAVLRELAHLTGAMPLPPRWSLGFQQCRYSYYPDAKVREIADQFRQRQLPCDVIWLDIHYMDGYRVFTFDPKRFPDPSSTNRYLHAKGFHSVWMIDPGVKQDPGYSVYDSGTDQGLWVQKKEGNPFVGKVWPGECVFPDFTMPATRQWWSGLYRDFVAAGVDGVWNDMNEPAVFESPNGTMPTANWHRGGAGLPAGPHLLYHNVYGMLMVSATRAGLLAAQPERRPFVLTRSNYLGGQRYAATWTGDNNAAMPYLQTSIPMSLNLGLSGQPVSGPDIGGYSGAITPELYGKWIALGPFFPFFRAHTAVDNPPREPWAFGAEIEKVAQTSLERRYRLLPYLYTLAYTASTSGEPIMQPLFFADPTDQKLRAEDRAFLFGPDLMVTPKWAEHVAQPKGIWRAVDLLDSARENDGYQARLKLRGGAILPRGRVVQNTGQNSFDPLTLLVSLNEKGEATGQLYEDAGDGYGYRHGDFLLTRFHARQEGKVITIHAERLGGKRKISPRQMKVRVISSQGILEGSGRETEEIRIATDHS